MSLIDDFFAENPDDLEYDIDDDDHDSNTSSYVDPNVVNSDEYDEDEDDSSHISLYDIS